MRPSWPKVIFQPKTFACAYCLPGFGTAERGVVPRCAFAGEELDVVFGYADARREVLAGLRELPAEDQLVLWRDAAQALVWWQTKALFLASWTT